MQLHQLQPKTKRTLSKRIGRGGKRGKTSGRGMKGQKARAGHSIRPEIRDLIKKLPKLRGHGVNRSRTVHDSRVKPNIVNLSLIEQNFSVGDIVTPAILKEKSLIHMGKGSGKVIVKILGNGDLTKKISFSGCTVSKSAKAKIEKAGGSIS
jgi:large subunit ribosomal protein L15